MKVALLISGYLRSYDINIKYIEDEILNKFGSVDVFLHITNNEKNEDKYFNSINDKKAIESFSAALNPLTTIIEDNTHYHEDKVINNIINQWNKLYKLNELKKLHERLSRVEYDLVIRYRPDLTIKDTDIFSNVIGGVISIPSDSKIDKSRLTNPTDTYICDALAFGDSKTMDKYFNIHNHILELIKLYGSVSETILQNYLTDFKIKYKLIDIDYGFTLSKCNVFAIAGDSGSGKSTLGYLLKKTFSDSFMLECDRYHKWERGHKNWDELTHLNPNANYITKMSEDIFNLKIGKDILQVDYDHNSGKFTEKQIINSSDNLIVCGLHSLYTDSVYDLKIFMDTDDQLKKKWKIKRDVANRGYTVDKVLESMKKREKDFNEFVDPQKHNADLVVKFYTNDIINLAEYDKDENLSLILSVDKSFIITNIIDTLDKSGIKYTIDNKDDKFIRFKFDEYMDNLDYFWNKDIPKTNSFYDYIMFFILNLTFTK